MKRRLCPCRRYATQVRRAPANERELLTASPEDSVQATVSTQKACTDATCTDSDEISLSSGEAPAAEASAEDARTDNARKDAVREKIRAGIRRLLARKDRDRNESQGGFTLIEVLGALVVGSIVFAFAAFGISGGLESARVSGFNESLALLRINIHESYASSRGFGSSTAASEDITQDLIDAGAIPQNWMTADGASVVHNFGGAVTVSGSVSNFSITASAIPEAVCRKIVSSQLEGWDSVSIGGNAVTELPPTGCEPDEDGVGVNELTFLAH